ncbi:MAG TPA: hypothetical protein VFL80_11760 [Thermoanaerobaculia bacterium]|nr:hypothetical protein [Thermoanaerobaculia bacterium]
MRFAIVSVALLGLLAAGCRAKTENPENTLLGGTTAAATDTAIVPSSPGGTALVPETATGTTVLVTLEDGRIAVADSDKIPPGPAVFTITNTGTQTHNLYIEGPGVSKAAGDNLGANATANVDATLTAGTYTLYCPVLNHREQGESLQLIIRPADAPPPTSTAVPGSPTTTS